MSRIGTQSIKIPEGVNITFNNNLIIVKGPKGELQFELKPFIKILTEDNTIKVKCENEEKFAKSMYGTTRAILSNMVEGVSKGFTKSLEIHGIGYRAALKGKSIELSLGFSHPVVYTPLDGVGLTMDEQKKNIIHVSGIDKQKVGEVAAQIRAYRSPEPYKGKGIKYSTEKIRRKAGKSAAK